MRDLRVSELSDQLCECGCGLRTFISPRTRSERGWVKGVPRRFRLGHNATGFVSDVDYVVNALTGCWVWQRGTNEKGYGVLVAGGQRRKKAHRLYFERFVGVIPEGYVVHHLCQNRRCVNPAHLEAVEPGLHAAEHVRERYAS